MTVVEATRIAGGASGKAGGLLAVWAYPSNIVPLSFKLHQDLAIEHGGEETWGYRRVSCGNLEAVGRERSELERLGAQAGVSLGKRVAEQEKLSRKSKSKDGLAGLPKDLDWVMPDLVKSYEKMGGSKETAQVHPYQFTISMMRLAQEQGVNLIIGSVTDINYTESNAPPPPPPPVTPPLGSGSHNPQPGGPPSPALSFTSASSYPASLSGRRRVTSITYTDLQTSKTHTLPATTAILAAGPWTSKLYPSAPISGLRAHSVTITPASPVSAYALFTEITIPQSPSSSATDPPPPPVSPEIYARPNNEIYVCGEGDMDVAVPATTADVVVDESRCDNLIAQVSSISDHIRLGRVTRKQACYLPILSVGGSGGPLIGETGTGGLLMASGHSCWGINNAPATGMLLSEMVFEGKAVSADIRQLDPRRIL